MTEQVFTEVPAPELLERVRSFKAQGWRFVQCHAQRAAEGAGDEQPAGAFDLTYTFSDDTDLRLANLRVHLGAGEGVASVSEIYPNAFMFENEMHDLFGVDVSGISIDYQGGFYHLHYPAPMARPADKPAKKAAKATPSAQ